MSASDQVAPPVPKSTPRAPSGDARPLPVSMAMEMSWVLATP
ncbi:MAG: hypothetical protein R3B09_22655 [Nannocystaceae bacterium]